MPHKTRILKSFFLVGFWVLESVQLVAHISSRSTLDSQLSTVD
jgi:hypothetical protein